MLVRACIHTRARVCTHVHDALPRSHTYVHTHVADAVSHPYQICGNMIRRHRSSVAGVVAGVFVVFTCMLSIMMDWIGSVAVLLKLSANRLPPYGVCVRFEQFRHCVIGARL